MADFEAKGEYDPFLGFQEACNKAVAENRAVRFLIHDMTNEEIRKKWRQVIDKKGCKIMKPDKLSHDVAVIPPTVHDFDFDAVDSRLVLPNNSGILLPGRDF